MPSLDDDFYDFWEKCNPKSNENSKFIFSSMFENYKIAQNKYYKSYYFILILLGVFFCLNNKITTAGKPFSIFSLEIANVSYVQWVICPLVCFYYYQGLTLLFLSRNYMQGIDVFMEHYIPELNSYYLTGLIEEPSFHNYENHISARYGSRISRWFIYFITAASVLIPFAIIVYMIYCDALLWYSISSLSFKCMIIIIVLIIMFRSIRIITSEFGNGDSR